MVQPAQRGRGASPSPAARGAVHRTRREWQFRVFECTGAARAAGSAGPQADWPGAIVRRAGADRFGQRPFRLRRTALPDNNTDYYPVPLSADTLRPGTVYADPYGHILMIVRRVAQTQDAAGIILAVDGQPDGTVARKRFWRGNFLFAQAPALGGPGFKRFRPVVVANGAMRRLNNAEIAKADFSLDQSQLGIEDFYDRMDDVMSPSPLDPTRAMQEAITSLEEQVKVRATSVENGRKFQDSKRGEATMPDGPAIFETSGAWEDFSAPSRDLRLLIAIDVVLGFPDRVARRPERYAMLKDRSVAEVKAELQKVLASELATRKFSYPAARWVHVDPHAQRGG
jgi:hypothetical protein